LADLKQVVLGRVRVRFALHNRPLSLDDLVYYSFSQAKASCDVRRSHTHFSQLEDLLLLDICETKNCLNHRGRTFCTWPWKLATTFSSTESAQ
jgi:hypothetical protein